MPPVSRFARVLRLATGIGLLAVAILHGLGYFKVSPLARGFGHFEGLFRDLWLSFAMHYLLLGCIVLLAAGRDSTGTRVLLGLAALVPLADALLQMVYVGFIPPTGILLGVAAIGLGAASQSRSSSNESAGG
jgi:hypothetical protein